MKRQRGINRIGVGIIWWRPGFLEKDHQGFTLIELMMVVAIFGILMVAVQAMFLNSMDLYQYGKEKSVTRQQLYYITEQIARFIRNTPKDQIQLLDWTGDGYNETLELETLEGDQIRFYLSNSKMFREKNGERRQIGEQITQFQITKVDQLYQIEIATQATGQPDPTWVKTGVTPRF